MFNLTYQKQVSGEEYPAGCYYLSLPVSLFNEITDSNLTNPKKFARKGGICLKEGAKHLHNHCYLFSRIKSMIALIKILKYI